VGFDIVRGHPRGKGKVLGDRLFRGLCVSVARDEVGECGMDRRRHDIEFFCVSVYLYL
jgi:hypothetical protein